MIIDKIRKLLSDRQERKRIQRDKFLSSSLSLGFDKIEFPIIIQDGDDLTIILSHKDFFSDPDLYFHEFDESMRLIDSAGRQFTWDYNPRMSSNFPDKFIKQFTFDELLDTVKVTFKDFKKKPDLGQVKSIKELITDLVKYC